MYYIKSLKDIGKENISLAGGKGASLGELTEAGVSVPRGFVLTSEAFESFLEVTKIQEEINALFQKVDKEKMHTIEYISEIIQGLILSADMPIDIIDEIEQGYSNLGTELVAVRSSATAEDGVNTSWAGQLESFLNTTQETLIQNVQKCWASLYTPRALFYRLENNSGEDSISVAVVIQKMIQSEVSGIAFSVHPVTEDHNRMVIEACYGLGDAVVSGSLTPDTYIVGKVPLCLLDTSISKQERMITLNDEREEKVLKANIWKRVEESLQTKQKISEDEIFELSKIIQKVENHFGFPVDVEWGYQNKKFFILQSRPITTLSEKKKEEKRNAVFQGTRTVRGPNDGDFVE